MVDAAEAIIQATHATADQASKHELDPGNNDIRDVRKYIFAIYMSFLSKSIAKQGGGQINYIDMDKWIANRDLSDRGAFQGALESKILCRELMKFMQPMHGVLLSMHTLVRRFQRRTGQSLAVIVPRQPFFSRQSSFSLEKSATNLSWEKC